MMTASGSSGVQITSSREGPDLWQQNLADFSVRQMCACVCICDTWG